jgi:hypothetical protein
MKSMNTAIRRVWTRTLVFVLSATTLVFAQPFQQGDKDPNRPSKVVDEPNAQPATSSSTNNNSAVAAVSRELPDAPAPAQSDQQNQQQSVQQQNPNSTPSGAAGAKAPTVRGAPASRPIGAAIAPTKQKQRRSLLIKVGLVAGAAVAVGSVVALSKGSPARPPGAP